MQTDPDKLPRATDVVVIGAGIAGICAAWYLQKAGTDVVVLEKGIVAGEQSSRNWGWCRQQGRDRAELPIVMESLERWQEIADELDEDIGFRREGSLYLCENDAELANHDRFMAFAPDHGLKTRRLGRAELERLLIDCPRRWQSALYTPDDARAEPSLAVPAMAAALRRRGVAVVENCAVERIVTQNRRISGVLTEHGEIAAARVLVAAGAWSTLLLEDCGIRLPQLTVKASVARTAAAPLIFNGNASGSQVAFRRRLDGGYTVATTDYLEIFPGTRQFRFLPDFLPLLRASLGKLRLRWPEITIDRRYSRHRVLNPVPGARTRARIRARLADRVPALAAAGFAEYWAGMIDALPDVVPVLDRAGEPDGLWISTGFSGHGFGIGPGAGRVIADLMQEKPITHDLDRFRLSRFSDGSRLELGPAI